MGRSARSWFIVCNFDCSRLTDQRLNSKASSYELPSLALPLRPVWITPSNRSFPDLSTAEGSFFPIICVSASRQAKSGAERRTGGFVYVQGSGDDHELWSHVRAPSNPVNMKESH
jgi:hypothetical protein